MYMLIFLLFDLGRILRLSRKRSLFDPIDIDSYRISGGIIFMLFCSRCTGLFMQENQEKALRCEYLQRLSASFTHTPDCQTKCPPEASAPACARPYRRSAPRWKCRSAALPGKWKNHRQDVAGSDHLLVIFSIMILTQLISPGRLQPYSAAFPAPTLLYSLGQP